MIQPTSRFRCESCGVLLFNPLIFQRFGFFKNCTCNAKLCQCVSEQFSFNSSSCRWQGHRQIGRDFWGGCQLMRKFNQQSPFDILLLFSLYFFRQFRAAFVLHGSELQYNTLFPLYSNQHLPTY